MAKPDAPAVGVDLGRALATVDAMLRAGHLPMALQACEALAQRWPDHALLWFTMALVLEDLGRRDDAVAALQRSLALQPAQAEAWVNLGLLHQALGDVDAALRAHAQAVRLRPELFGRVAMALCSQRGGEVWLSADALRAELTRLASAAA
jgi:tetratricopeptide (TPR) repeat protein